MSYTKAELKQALQDYCENSETKFVANLDNFIETAEQRIFTTIDLEFFRKNSELSTTAGEFLLSIPDDFLASFSMSVEVGGGKEFLLLKDVNFLQEAYPFETTRGIPRFYGIYDVNTFLLSPTPDVTYSIELHYYYRPPSLTEGPNDGRTWLSINAPNAMLYGSLMEAYTFMKGESDLLELYNGRFIEAVGRIKDLGEARENYDAYRDGLPRSPRS